MPNGVELSIAPNPQQPFLIKTTMNPFNPLSRISRFLAGTLALATASGLLAQPPKRPDIVVADFEGETYGDWQVGCAKAGRNHPWSRGRGRTFLSTAPSRCRS